MKILLVHPVRLPPRDYGGVERVVLWLAKGLVERGHSVFVAAEVGSELPAGCQLVEAQKGFSLQEWLRVLPVGLDVTHFMAPMPEEIWSAWPTRQVLTVHGNGQLGEKYPKNSVFLSQDHARRHGASVYVYNGIDPAEYQFEPQSKQNWNLFLSKTSWSVKNVRAAARYSARARQRLKIAGGHRPWLFRLQCQLSSGFDWVGPVSGRQKAELLTQARAFLFPVRWPEPFGLVVAEAMMSGTPVLASPRGSLMELVPPSAGVLLQGEEEWVHCLGRPQDLPAPEACRQWALSRFHYQLMAQNYEALYLKVSGGASLHIEQPATLDIPDNRDWREKRS